MSLVSLGSIDLATSLPGANAAGVAGAAGINGALPDINARIAALGAFAPAPISFSADIAAANNIAASIGVAVSAGLTPPDIAGQIAQIAALLAALEAEALAVQANLTLVTNFLGLLAAGGIDAYAWDGARNALGAAVTSALGSSTAHSNAIVLVTTNGATWTAMQSVFKTTP